MSNDISYEKELSDEMQIQLLSIRERCCDIIHFTFKYLNSENDSKRTKKVHLIREQIEFMEDNLLKLEGIQEELKKVL